MHVCKLLPCSLHLRCLRQLSSFLPVRPILGQSIITSSWPICLYTTLGQVNSEQHDRHIGCRMEARRRELRTHIRGAGGYIHRLPHRVFYL